MTDILELERRGWQVLSTGNEEAKQFYAQLLREDAVMLFPGGMRIDGKQEILKSLEAQPWESFELEETELLDITAEVATLVYRVAARREGSPLYEALVSSTYVRENGAWKLVLHQQSQA